MANSRCRRSDASTTGTQGHQPADARVIGRRARMLHVPDQAAAHQVLRSEPVSRGAQHWPTSPRPAAESSHERHAAFFLKPSRPGVDPAGTRCHLQLAAAGTALHRTATAACWRDVLQHAAGGKGCCCKRRRNAGRKKIVRSYTTHQGGLPSLAQLNNSIGRQALGVIQPRAMWPRMHVSASISHFPMRLL